MIELLDRVLESLPATDERPLQYVLRFGGSGPRDTSQAIVLGRSGRPLAVARMARGTAGARALAAEHEKLLRLERDVLPRLPGTVPRPLGLTEQDGLTVLMESHLPGRRIKDLAPGRGRSGRATTHAVVDWLIGFTLACGLEPAGPGEAALLRLVDEPVREYIAAFERDATEDAFLRGLPGRLRDALPCAEPAGVAKRAATGGRPLAASLPLAAGHGDFSDANVLVAGDRVGVVDWDEPIDRVLPGADLFHFLASLAATRHGLNERRGFERGFVLTFFDVGPASKAARASWTRYREALGLAPSLALPLFALAWVSSALAKLRYLQEVGEASGHRPENARSLVEPETAYPVTFFADGRCLNVALCAQRAEAFAL